jgi:hypothetical protein
MVRRWYRWHPGLAQRTAFGQRVVPGYNVFWFFFRFRISGWIPDRQTGYAWPQPLHAAGL